MIRTEAAIKDANHFPFSGMWIGSGRASFKANTRHPGLVRPVVAHALNLRDSQLVVGCICFLSAAKLLLCAVLKLWLFEP